MKKKRPLKRSMSGFEIEAFLLDNSGNISDKSDALIKEASKKGISIKPECSRNMIELFSYPSKRIRSTAVNLFENLASTIDIAQKKDLHIYPFATYPGVMPANIRKDSWYNVKEKVIGERFRYAGYCCGYHQHYTLPRGMFDYDRKFLNLKIRSKVKKSFIDSYNMLIASDPAVTSLLQSSPFTEGRYLGKDSRMLLYRGGRKLKFNKGVYSRLQMFGGLPPYKQTLGDLITVIHKRQEKWRRLMVKRGLNTEGYVTDKNLLDFCWGPIKINMLGTLEYRGGDMNLPKYLFSAAIMLKFILRRIQQDFLFVVPSDAGYEEAFKIEGNVVIVPPHTHVRNVLQPLSAYEGLSDRIQYNYVKRFLRFAKSCVYDTYKPALKPIEQIVERKKTISDELIAQVKKQGYSISSQIPQEVCAELAIKSSERLVKELDETIKIIGKGIYW